MSMNHVVYDWRRYWVPSDGAFSFDSDGFLLPPANDSDRLFWPKTDVVGFDALIAKPCLVLLGEPGIGKTFAQREGARRAREARPEAKILERNLGIYASDTHLVEDVFNSAEFHWWNSGCGELHVYLDSFDECLLRLDTVASLLGDRFGRLPHVHNLLLRVSSRTAEWRTSLEHALRQKWGQESVGVYELAPLTREQVLSAAQRQLSDAERFVAEIIASDVVSFAIKPLKTARPLECWSNQVAKVAITALGSSNPRCSSRENPL